MNIPKMVGPVMRALLHCTIKRRDGTLLTGKLHRDKAAEFCWILTSTTGETWSWGPRGNFFLSGAPSRLDAVRVVG